MDERDVDLLDMLARHARVAIGYAEEMGPRWAEDPKTVDAISKRIDQIGELAKRVHAEALASIEGVDWRGVKAFREILVHDYEDLDLGILSDVVTRKLPNLVEAVEQRLFVEGSGG